MDAYLKNSGMVAGQRIVRKDHELGSRFGHNVSLRKARDPALDKVTDAAAKRRQNG
jgi:hypothetical protein